jgi:hypothetical protein
MYCGRDRLSDCSFVSLFPYSCLAEDVSQAVEEGSEAVY